MILKNILFFKKPIFWYIYYFYYIFYINIYWKKPPTPTTIPIIYIMIRRKSFSSPHARTDRTPVIPSVAHVVHHHAILVKIAFRLSYWLKLVGQIWLVYARYTVGLALQTTKKDRSLERSCNWLFSSVCLYIAT